MTALDDVVARMTEATSGFLQPPYLQEGFDAVPNGLLAALLAERHAANPARRVHLNGWEMFGIVHLTKSNLEPATSRPIRGGVEWPEAEVHEGIFRISVTAHGDDPSGAYLHVHGTDAFAVEICFARLCTAVRSLLGEVWP